jgi:aspartyl protease family protein
MAIRNAGTLALAILLWLSPAFAEELSIHVMGLFKNTAIVEVNGVARTLKKGKTSPEGITLISADARKAEVEYQGKRMILTMGSSGAMGLNNHSQPLPAAQPSSALSLIREPNGMFHVRGTINNMAVTFLVDTGASTVAMNHHTAQRIGIPYRATGKPISVTTASGVVQAYSVRLASVRVGNLELKNVEAAVIEGEQPHQVLLGNSFLGKFKVEQDGDTLVIGERH